jgi:hypothetical protein
MREPHETTTNRQKERTMTHEIVMTPERTEMVGAQEVRKRLHHRGRLVVALALGAIVTLLGVLTRPSPPSLSTMVTGDATLAALARPLLPGHLDRVNIAVVDGSTVTYAGFGANEHTQ